jgi:tetratricopeptide (TPR) repeat protein
LFFKIGRSTDAVNAFKVSSFPVLFDPNETSFTDYLFMLATIHTITGDWQKMRQSAKHGLYVVLNLSQTHGENQKVSQARLLASLGAGCAYQRSFAEGLKYLHDSIQVIRTTTTPFSKGLEMFSMCMMAYCYGLIGNFKLAFNALEEAIQLDTQHFSEPKADILLVQSRLWAYQGKTQIAKNFVTETIALYDFESTRDQFYNVYITAGANNLIAILRAILYIVSQPSNAAIQFSNEIRQEIFSDLNTVAILSLTNQEHGGLIYALMYDVQIVCERNNVNELLVLQMLRDATSEFPKTNGYASALDVRYECLTSGNHSNNNNHNDGLLMSKGLNL